MAAGELQERRIETAFRIAFGRPPTSDETIAAETLLDKARARYAREKLPAPECEMKALARLCHMLLCANEFLYVG
jgi:hypothetical protein